MLFCILSLAVAGFAQGQPPVDSMEARHEALSTSGMTVHVVRLRPGDDLQEKLAAYAKAKRLTAAVILTAVGSLQRAAIRYADQPAAAIREGKFEIVSLVGTLDAGSMHVHLSLSDGTGQARRRGICLGCSCRAVVRTYDTSATNTEKTHDHEPRHGHSRGRGGPRDLSNQHAAGRDSWRLHVQLVSGGG